MDDDELFVAMRGWSDDRRAEAARSRKTAARWQQQLAAEEMRLTGLLLDAEDRRQPVQVSTASGRVHAGAVEMVGQDFAGVRPPGRPTALIRLDSITSVQLTLDGKAVPVPSAREVPADAAYLADVIGDLVEEQARIRFVLTGASEMRGGQLLAIGEDIVTLALDGQRDAVLFVAIAHFSEISLIR